MRIFGLPVPFTGNRQKAANLSSVRDNRGWYRIMESFPGAWQTNTVVDRNLALSYHAVYSCMTLIASDVSKLRLKLVKREKGVWQEIEDPKSPIFYRPNSFQTRNQFFENWLLSKLAFGNTYVLMVRGAENRVTKFYILDPAKVTPLVSDDGSVFYQLSSDNIAGLTEDVTVPASEIIHDRFNCLFHPLVGVSPLFAAGTAAMQGLRIQNNSTWFFGNKSVPGGVLTAPGAISDETAARLKENWETKFSGENAGKIAVLGDGLKFEAMTISAADSQLIEQLKWTAEVVCGVFHVPAFMAGVGTEPNYNNVQNLTLRYYSQCLQRLLEDIEAALDAALGHGPGLGVEFDLDGLLRMDSVTQMQVMKEGISAGVIAPNEARAKIDMKAVAGGETPYLQQQNYSLAALAKRDAQDDPFATEKKPAAQAEPAANDNSDEARAQRSLRRRAMLAGMTGLDTIPLDKSLSA